MIAGEGAVLDRSVYSDNVFASVCTQEGFISNEGIISLLYCNHNIGKLNSQFIVVTRMDFQLNFRLYTATTVNVEILVLH